jgi:hypothetical protein
MAPLTAEELAALCRESDPETVAGFVAALQAARGRAVETADGPAFVLDGERVVVPGGGRAADADVVVTAGRDAGAVDARSLDAAELRDALLYAVDRETADALLREQFDRPLASFEGTDGTVTAAGRAGDGRTPEQPATERGAATARDPDDAGTRAGAADGDAARADERRRSRRALAATLAVAVVLAALAAGVPGGLLAGLGAGPGTSGAEVQPAGPGPNGSWELVGGSTPDGGAATADEGLPPGVDASGDVDEERLVAATAAHLRNRSYRVTVTYREFRGGIETAVFSQTARVGNGSRIRVTTARFGTFEDAPPRLVYGDEGVDRRAIVDRDVGGTRERSRAGRDPVLERLSTYLGYYLSVEASRVADRRAVDGTRSVRVVTDGDPWPGVENATGSAVVTEDGLVRMVRRAYGDPNSAVGVVVTIRVSDVGRTNVTADDE